jgi:dipeptidase E
MKLFLSSSSEALPLLMWKLPNKGKGAIVLFVANASDNIPGDHWWVKADKDALIRLGCKINEIDLRNISEGEFTKAINSSDLIHFCGGSTLYLISTIKKAGVGTIISKAVKQGKIMYSGTSAGSMIATDDMKLKLCKYDEEEKELVKTMTDYSGLGLVNFLIIPHINNKDFVESNKKMIEHLPGNPVALIFIDDNQAVWVEDNKFEIFEIK